MIHVIYDKSVVYWMSEFISKTLIDNIIKANKHLVQHRGESFGVNEEKLSDVINTVNTTNVPADNDVTRALFKRKRIIKKASLLLAGIAYNQPFNNGNKATSYVITKHYLRKNGYSLILKTKEEEKELFVLLDTIVMKFEGEDIVSDAETYLDNKITPKF
ncbi:MAG: Fic family protein [Thaumarchaeota archaeon]|nr:Fic family protein [Nitrososphaerota archaeon]